jgi:predicted ferric reductase
MCVSELNLQLICSPINFIITTLIVLLPYPLFIATHVLLLVQNFMKFVLLTFKLLALNHYFKLLKRSFMQFLKWSICVYEIIILVAYTESRFQLRDCG